MAAVARVQADALEPLGAIQQVVRKRQTIGDRFAGAGLRRNQQVAAFEKEHARAPNAQERSKIKARTLATVLRFKVRGQQPLDRRNRFIAEEGFTMRQVPAG